MKVLLRYGADPRIRNNAGLTPREMYETSVEGYQQDPFVIKVLQQKENEYVKQQFRDEIQMVQGGAAGSMDVIASRGALVRSKKA